MSNAAGHTAHRAGGRSSRSDTIPSDWTPDRHVVSTDRLHRGGPFWFSGAVRPIAPALCSLLSLALVVGACSVDDGSGGQGRPTVTTTEVAADDAPSTTTTTLPPSVGVVTFAETSHELTATCYAPGAGEVLAIGLATTPEGERIEVYLQAFLGAPYVGIAVTGEETTTYEAAVDRPLDITYDADILRVDDVALVSGLDLETGEATDAGVGSVVIECRAYETDLPSGFVAG